MVFVNQIKRIEFNTIFKILSWYIGFLQGLHESKDETSEDLKLMERELKEEGWQVRRFERVV